jgi:hypothetical protein
LTETWPGLTSMLTPSGIAIGFLPIRLMVWSSVRRRRYQT